MPRARDAPAKLQPPGPGSWSLDTAHFPKPVTRFVIELFSEPARRGFAEATARYGLLLDHIEWAFVDRWAYLRPSPFWSMDELGGTLTREAWDRLVGATPALGERLATSAGVFEERRWREDVRRWDGHVKPALRGAHLKLQAIVPSGLHDGELVEHLDGCRENLRRAIYNHHLLNVAPVIPAGDLLAHAREWTGRPVAELVALLRGDVPHTDGARSELAVLAEALRADPAARQLLRADEPENVLATLLSRNGEVGRAAAGYVGLVGHRTVGSGSDVGEQCLHELPHVLVETIRAAVDGTRAAGAADATAELRADVPPAGRSAFDALLAEARASHRLRDERAIYCDVWAYGLARRAILAAGLRLAEAGTLEQPAHLVEAGHLEMRSLLTGADGPSGGELAARARHREQATEDQAPAVLGGPPGQPVPTGWLPAGAARTELAFRTYVAAMSAEHDAHDAHEAAAAVSGLPASPGSYRGRARVIRGAAELGRIVRGDVLVIGSTGPAINVVLALVGAIVTDRGGMLSHAAIVAREFAIPAVVGTGEATARIPDGALVLVDATAGTVTVLDYDPAR